MNKLFILVDSPKELEKKIKNIEKICKNRKRYDDLINYYASNEFDTKNIIETKIIELTRHII